MKAPLKSHRFIYDVCNTRGRIVIKLAGGLSIEMDLQTAASRAVVTDEGLKNLPVGSARIGRNDYDLPAVLLSYETTALTQTDTTAQYPIVRSTGTEVVLKLLIDPGPPAMRVMVELRGAPWAETCQKKSTQGNLRKLQQQSMKQWEYMPRGDVKLIAAMADLIQNDAALQARLADVPGFYKVAQTFNGQAILRHFTTWQEDRKDMRHNRRIWYIVSEILGMRCLARKSYYEALQRQKALETADIKLATAVSAAVDMAERRAAWAASTDPQDLPHDDEKTDEMDCT